MGTMRISERALYQVTVIRIDARTRERWIYPSLLSEAASVRGALTDALLAPLSRWHALNDEEAG